VCKERNSHTAFLPAQSLPAGDPRGGKRGKAGKAGKSGKGGKAGKRGKDEGGVLGRKMAEPG
jgi:hypothetical protein